MISAGGQCACLGVREGSVCKRSVVATAERRRAAAERGPALQWQVRRSSGAVS
jgi:hypothetical protein